MMRESLLRLSRIVRPGNKILFDDSVACRVVFADEPTVPALLPYGTKIKMSTPLTMIGGRQEMAGAATQIALYANGIFMFDNGQPFQLKDIRGGNWGIVLE